MIAGLERRKFLPPKIDKDSFGYFYIPSFFFPNPALQDKKI
jgi:hypothetical protein